MFHYLICCKLTFDLQRNNKLHILSIHYYNVMFQNFLKLYFEIKLDYLYKIILICIIHNHSITLIKCPRSLMFNEILLQFKANIQIPCV